MLIETIHELRQALKGKQSIGFVPTMGYLHEGHLSLIHQAKEDHALVVVSIFVNPTQFAPNEDFESYPRKLDRDYKMATEAGANIVFHPSVDELYIDGASTSVIVEGPITSKLCGASRPTHFKGVTTVVATLFNLVRPNSAYFGQKDAQQAIIIQKMVRDLHMPIEVVICPIVREKDGLAMSSRNTYLSKEERQQALSLNEALTWAASAVHSGNKDAKAIKATMRRMIQSQPLAKIDYIEIVSSKDLEDLRVIEGEALGAVAVRFGTTRLIDNRYLINDANRGE